MTFQQATVAAIADEMRADPDVFILGEDVGKFGGPLRSTAGLFDEFGAEGRVIDTPMSEGTFTGAAIGAAMSGKRPIVDLMFLEFLPLIMQQLLDAGAMHYYSGGSTRVPLVVRAKFGVGPFHGHAYDHHSWLMNVPGIKIVAPSTPTDAYQLMRAAIRDDNPVMFLEHMALYHAGKSDVEQVAGLQGLGHAKVVQKGQDISIFASALMVKRALAVAKAVESSGISVEVIDLQTISPIDETTVLTSARKTGRVIVLSEAIERGTSANDVIALIADQAFGTLKAPIKRLAPKAVPVPYARELEKEYLPSEQEIAVTVEGLLAKRNQ